ncbi:hypothetical protein MSLAZ_2066 [Methanosarcina lacustris Z-7289]|uniref:Lipoprotein n=1 Tax=Methanosarcina lacustris Z-7289 TaxID=1434111 RepID=A0A0E3S7E4_9EURY|nr:hypothetical protein [Methanosarcina lacustris]AKB75327.1 hypothetical protein MSLAZ_2066 [Methanosarcina lacustris Z-7289]
MNKTQKALAMLLIIAAVVFVAGCSDQSSTQQKTADSTENTGEQAGEQPDQSAEWMQTTSADALNVSNAANALIDASLNGSDPQKITTLITYTEEEANTSSYESAQYYYNDDLETAVQKYAEMMGSYGAVAEWMKMTYDHLNAGDASAAQMTFNKAQESLGRGNAHYAEYKAMIEDFKKKHPETA